MKIFAMVLLTLGMGSLNAHGIWRDQTMPEEHFVEDAVGHRAVAAPEIDPGSALAGLTLLVGGIAVVRGRKGK